MMRRLAGLMLLLGALGWAPANAQLTSSLSEQPRRQLPPNNGSGGSSGGTDAQSSLGLQSVNPRPNRPFRPAPDKPGPDAPTPQRPSQVVPPSLAPPTAVLPPIAAAPGPDLRPMTATDLVAQAEAATVFIVADDGTGSGFFITPDTIATNAHVVSGARNGTVLVASRKLGRVLRGRILYQSSLQGREWPDIAFVRVDANAAPAVITLSPEVAKLDPVVAAGFPGLLSHSDQGVRRLINGEAGAAPELVFERGAVATFSHEAANLVVHSAFLANGNSGGPLFDPCGRAIGINSAILRDQRVGGQYNIAQDVQELVRHAQRLNIPIRYTGGKCAQG